MNFWEEPCPAGFVASVGGGDWRWSPEEPAGVLPVGYGMPMLGRHGIAHGGGGGLGLLRVGSWSIQLVVCGCGVVVGLVVLVPCAVRGYLVCGGVWWCVVVCGGVMVVCGGVWWVG